MEELRNLYETARKSRKENPLVSISNKWNTILSYSFNTFRISLMAEILLINFRESREESKEGMQADN
jgi:hypothetical protein